MVDQSARQAWLELVKRILLPEKLSEAKRPAIVARKSRRQEPRKSTPEERRG